MKELKFLINKKQIVNNHDSVIKGYSDLSDLRIEIKKYLIRKGELEKSQDKTYISTSISNLLKLPIRKVLSFDKLPLVFIKEGSNGEYYKTKEIV